MRSSRSTARARRIAGRPALGAIAVCLALGIASAADAQEARLSAGSHCGGGFGLVAAEPGSPLGLELLTAATRPASPITPPARPCSGPSCSKGAPAPMPTPAAPPSSGPTSETWALWSAPPLSDPTHLGRPSADEPAARPSQRSASVFHPPR